MDARQMVEVTGRPVAEVCCVGCGATVPGGEGPRHAYMLSAASSWERYCSLEDWKAGLVGEEAIGVVQDLVDCFAVQHAANPERRNRQSVAVHLMSLCCGVERAWTGRQRRARIGTWVGREHPVLEPRAVRFALTVSDVAVAPPRERPAIIESMASATWAAWWAHHGVVRAWLDG